MPHPDIRAVLISFWSGHMVQTEVRRRLLFHLAAIRCFFGIFTTFNYHSSVFIDLRLEDPPTSSQS